MKKTITIICLLIFLSAFTALYADIGEDIKAFKENNGEKYIQPFIYSMSANMNNGWYNSAETGLLHFGFTFNTMLAMIPDEAKTFMALSPDTSLYNEEEVETATCFGENGGTFTSDFAPDLHLPDGYALKALPFAVPQAELGLPGGFGVQLRFVPKVKIDDDIGKVSLLGFGVKNEISRQFPLLPIALAFQASYQRFELVNVATYKSLFVNLHASKSLIVVPVTLFGGVGLENGTFEADYTYENPTTKETETINFDIKNENELRFNMGARFRIMIIDLILEYSLGEYNSARAGLGFSL